MVIKMIFEKNCLLFIAFLYPCYYYIMAEILVVVTGSSRINTLHNLVTLPMK
jgi:hypothetical protein